MLNVRNLGYGSVRAAKIERAPTDIQERLRSHLLLPNDIVFGRKGAVDRHVLVTPKQAGWMQGSDCIRLRLSVDAPVLPVFLSKLLLTDEHKRWMENQCSHGATMASLNQEIIRRIEVEFPSISRQRRVVAVLLAFDELIEINERQIELLEALVRASALSWIWRGHSETPMVLTAQTQPPQAVWRLGRVADLGELYVDGVDPSEFDSDDRYVGLEHLPRRSMTLKGWGSIESVKSRKLRFQPGDTLFAKIRPNLHKVAWAPFAGLASSDAMVFRPRQGKSAPAFLAAILASDAVVAEAAATANGTKMPRANPEVLMDFPVRIPNDGVLDEIEAVIRSWLDWCAVLAALNTGLQEARDLLLPRLITGQLDISDVDLGVLTPTESA